VPTKANHAQPKAAQQAIQRLPNGRWPKGQSGCPEVHNRYVERQRLMREEAAALETAVIAELGGKRKLSALELILAGQVASELAKSRHIKDTEMRVRSLRAATALLDRLKAGRAAKESAGKGMFDAYGAFGT
jgi:hypothetical protein